MTRILPLLLLLSCASAEAAAAQLRDSLYVGARVRVWAPADGLEGRVGEVRSIEGDRLRLLLLRRDSISSRTRDVSLSAVERLELSRGREHWARPATTGGLMGLAAGAGLALLVGSNCPSDGMACYVVVFGAPPAGLLLGAFAGAAGRREFWTRVAPPR